MLHLHTLVQAILTIQNVGLPIYLSTLYFGLPSLSHNSILSFKMYLNVWGNRGGILVLWHPIQICMTLHAHTLPVNVETTLVQALQSCNPSALCSTISAGHLAPPSLRASKGRTKKSQLFSVLAPQWWNELPADVRNAESLTSFLKRLKTQEWIMGWPRRAGSTGAGDATASPLFTGRKKKRSWPRQASHWLQHKLDLFTAL